MREPRMVWSGEATEDSIAVMSRQALVGRLAQVKEQFRATSDILKVLTSSSGDPDKVFDAVVENARTLLNAAVAQIYLVKGATYVIARQSGMSEEHRRLLEQHPIQRDRGTLVGRVTIDRRIHHIPDAVADPDYSRSDLQRMAGFRSMIGAPHIVGDEVVGALNVMRNRVAPI
jgi:GAF domain-containing protein